MKALVSKWGNSLAIRLPKAAVESLHLQEGEAVELSIEGDHIEIRAARVDTVARQSAPTAGLGPRSLR